MKFSFSTQDSILREESVLMTIENNKKSILEN